jgi:hypothetical protein
MRCNILTHCGTTLAVRVVIHEVRELTYLTGIEGLAVGFKLTKGSLGGSVVGCAFRFRIATTFCSRRRQRR